MQVREAEQTSRNYQHKVIFKFNTLLSIRVYIAFTFSFPPELSNNCFFHIVYFGSIQVRELENQLNAERKTKNDAAKFLKPPMAPLRQRPPLQRITNQLPPSRYQTIRRAQPLDKENSLLTSRASETDSVKPLYKSRRITLAPVVRNVPAQPRRRSSIAVLQDVTQRTQALSVSGHQNNITGSQLSQLMIPNRRSLATFTPIRETSLLATRETFLRAATTPEKTNFNTLASSSKYRSPSLVQAFPKSKIPTVSSPRLRLRLMSSPTNAENLDGAHPTTNKLCFSVQKRVIVGSPAQPKPFMNQGHMMFNQAFRGGNLVARLGTAQRVLCKNRRQSVI